MQKIKTRVKGLMNDEAGATAVEYAIMIAAITAVIVLAVGALGISVTDLFNQVLPAFE